MTFTSSVFIVFFAVVLLFRFLLQGSSRRGAFQILLLLGSLVFYSWFRPVYVFIILIPILVDYFCALMIERYDARPRLRTAFLTFSVVSNLGLLALFKYYVFFLGTVREMLLGLGMSVPFSIPTGFELPLGISFFTFQSMSYTIDVYRRQIKVLTNPREYLLFASFFPQMVSGPVVRAREFLYQIKRDRRIHWKVWSEGFYLIASGLFFKMVLADHLGAIVNTHWSSCYLGSSGSLTNILVAVLFSAQIFCDFSGYTNIARGISLLLGFRLPLNFNAPYIARSFSEFWQRWHITLSSWLRDYLYISLGGNRISKWRTYVNLMLVMLLGGLWHGAAFGFIIWGLIHGGMLALERFLGLQKDGRRWGVAIPWFLVVQLSVLIAWAFFRSDSLAHGGAFVATMFRFQAAPDGIPHELLMGLLFVIPVVTLHLRVALHDRGILKKPTVLEKYILFGAMAAAIVTTYAQTKATFIYFQF